MKKAIVAALSALAIIACAQAQDLGSNELLPSDARAAQPDAARPSEDTPSFADGAAPGPAAVPASCVSATTAKSTVGCDYYAVMPDALDNAGSGGCFAAFVTNTSPEPIRIQVDRDGQSLDASGFARVPSGSGRSLTYAPLPNGQLPPGEIAVLFLARFEVESATDSIDCPEGISPAYTRRDATIFGSGFGNAFHIVTSAPVVAYDVFPYGGGVSGVAGATLLVPTSAWDKNYIAVSAYRGQPPRPGFVTIGPSIAIVAAEDDTTVTFRPTVAIDLVQTNVGIRNANAGEVQSYVLARGQVLQITQDEELTGTPILADKPIGVWGGFECLALPKNVCCCDSAHQQMFPVQALGHEYVGVRFRNRFDGVEETPPWRVVGAVDGTQLTYDPEPPPGAPTSLGLGQVAEFRTGKPFVVRSQDSQHPIYVASYMEGCRTVNQALDDCRGDPEFVNVIPPAQFARAYTFFTDPTYPETNLVIVRKKGAQGFRDVSLDCAGVLAGWQPVGNGESFEFVRFDLSRGNFEKQGACDNGRHTMSSDEVFGVTVWGWGSAVTGGTLAGAQNGTEFYTQAVSYGYPAGAGVQPINSVVVPPK